MLKNKFIIFVLFIIFFSIGCARRGNISGGNKDTIAPILRYSLPKNYTTNFKGNEIKLYFNEYIQLKDVAKQLVISPPMTTAPDVLPNNPSKMIKIVIKDTLRPDTTYSLNFGQSLQDNNEGNSFPDFKYVFSTGSEIDSLKIEGTIKDALEQKTDNFVSIMLYEINEKYTDSVIYKQKPRYVTNTLDSLKTWKIENIKAGKYLLIALKDYNSNNKFDAKKDKIGFVKEQILIPTTKSYELKLFKEQLKTKFLKPSQASGNRAIIGFEGDVAGIVGTLKNKNEVLETVITKIPKNDSLQIWYKKIKTDSLQLSLTKDIYSKSSYFKIKDQKKDTLNLTPSQTGNLNFRDVFSLSSSTPIIKFDDSKISLRNKDSVVVPFSKTYDAFNQQIIFDFKKEEGQKYVFRFIPGAITDFYNKSNDTLVYKLETKNFTEFGNVIMTLENAKRFPILMQLTNEKGDVLASEYSEKSPVFKFEGLEPNKYFLRIIYDDNKSKKWEAGNFLEKRQAEEVIYFPKQIDVRANWDVIETFILSD